MAASQNPILTDDTGSFATFTTVHHGTVIRLVVIVRPSKWSMMARLISAFTVATVLALVLAIGGGVVLLRLQANAPGPSGIAMPMGDIPGWKQTFADDFKGGNLADRWHIYNGQPGGDPGGWFSPSHVSQSDGMLVITGSREDTPNGNIYATGGISNSKVFKQTYGRFEYRFRMDEGYGINFVMLLWPSDDKWPPEIDVAEDTGLSRNLILATLHYGENNTTIIRSAEGLADFTTWHTAGVEWRPGSLTFYLDGKQWATIDSPEVPDTPMSMTVQSQAWPCGHSFSDCPNATTPARVNFEVDWVVAYSEM